MAIYQNKLIKSLVNDIFLLDDGDFTILYHFAQKGETTRHNIITTQDKKTVSKKIDILFEKNFLILRKKTPFRNQPHKSTKYFGLSFKGFLASLHYCDVEDNYLIKKYLKGIENKKLSNLILCYIKYELLCFFSYNSIRGLVLDKMTNISDWFENYESLIGFSDDEEKYLNELKDHSYKLYLELDKLIPKKSPITSYVNTWYFHMNEITYGSTPSKILQDIIETPDLPKSWKPYVNPLKTNHHNFSENYG